MPGWLLAVALLVGIVIGAPSGWFAHEHFAKPEIVTNTVVYDIENRQEMRSYMNVENNQIQSVEVYEKLFVVTNFTTNTLTNWTKTTNWISVTNIH